MATIKEYLRKDGGTTYYVMFRLGEKQTSRPFDDAKGAEKFKKTIGAIGAAAAVEMLEAKRSSRTVDSLFKEWLAYKRAGMTAEAHRDYERQYEKWIKKPLGWRDAELVTERDVQAWVDKTLSPELAPKSVAKQHALLHGMYKWASSKTVGHVANNPCTETRLPKRKKRPPKGLTIPEMQAILDAAAAVDDNAKADRWTVDLADAADVVAAMAGTGWRPGEVLGLLVGSVDAMPSGAVYVTMNSVYRRGEGIVEDGKTDAAGRRLRVLGPGAVVLARRVVGKGINDPVFPHPNPGKGRGHAKDAEGRPVVAPWRPANFSRNYWPKLVEAAGLAERGPTPYWLRHTHVALCHAAGMTLPEIQRRIGHESIQTTIDVYGRMIDGMNDEVADRLEQLLVAAPMTRVVAGEVVADSAALTEARE